MKILFPFCIVILSNNTEFFRKKKNRKLSFLKKKVSFYDIILNFPAC